MKQSPYYRLPFRKGLFLLLLFYWTSSDNALFGQLEITLTSDNPYPSVDCGIDNIVHYTVEFCNTSDDSVGFKFTAESPLNRQFITAYSNSLQLASSSVAEELTGGFSLSASECMSLTFTATVTSLSTSFTTTATAFLTPSDTPFPATTTVFDITEIMLSGNLLLSELITATTLPADGCDGTPRKIHFGSSARLEVDIDYCFSNTKFVMESGAEIVVTENKLLKFEACGFLGCEELWKGITVEEACSTSLKDCIIRDAQYAVRSQNAAFISCINNVFDRNYVGFYVPDNNGPTQSTFITMQGNTFDCTGDL